MNRVQLTAILSLYAAMPAAPSLAAFEGHAHEHSREGFAPHRFQDPCAAMLAAACAARYAALFGPDLVVVYGDNDSEKPVAILNGVVFVFFQKEGEPFDVPTEEYQFHFESIISTLQELLDQFTTRMHESDQDSDGTRGLHEVALQTHADEKVALEKELARLNQALFMETQSDCLTKQEVYNRRVQMTSVDGDRRLPTVFLAGSLMGTPKLFTFLQERILRCEGRVR